MSPPAAPDAHATNLARNLKSLRDSLAITQARLATLSGVPRPTLAHLESGGGNPTLSVLVKVADALNVSIEELIGAPRDTGRHYKATELLRTTRQGVPISMLLPDKIAGVDIERMVFRPGKRLTGAPHTAGSREYLFCERGLLTLTASGSTYRLRAGEVVVFRGNQKHGYHNPGDHEAVAISIVLLPPAG